MWAYLKGEACRFGQMLREANAHEQKLVLGKVGWGASYLWWSLVLGVDQRKGRRHWGLVKAIW